MKKFFAVLSALGLCVAIAMPAAAAVSVSGDVGYSIKYDSRGGDDPLSTNTNNNDARGFSIFPAVQKALVRFDWEAGPATPFIELAMNKYDTKWAQTSGADINDDEVELRFGADYTSESGVFGGGWIITREWQDDRATVTGGTFEDTEYDANVWWQVNPMLKLSFGTPMITGAAKTEWKVGVPGRQDNRHLARAEMALPVGKFTVDFINPDDHGRVAAGAGGTWFAGSEMNTTPGLSLSFNGKFGPIVVMPGYTTQSFSYERGTGGAGPAAGSDDGYTAWIAELPVMANVGPLSLMAAYAWGENVSDAFAKDTIEKTKAGANWAADVSTGPSAGGVVRFDDTKYEGWNIEAAINAGIGKLSAGYGYDSADRYLTATTRTEVERDVFFVKYAIPVGKGFTITPQFAKFNDGEVKNNGVVTAATDDATRKLYIVNFNVKF